MGIAGLAMHYQNAKSERYRVLGVQKTLGEQALLRGVAEQRGLVAGQVQVLSGGISSNTRTLLENGGTHSYDMVIASRVHSAGNDLVAGIMRAGQLLRHGGLLVARGARRYQGGGYDQILGHIKHDRTMIVAENRIYERRSPTGVPESNRVIIARAR